MALTLARDQMICSVVQQIIPVQQFLCVNCQFVKAFVHYSDVTFVTP
jgi:hypothetical protein